MTPDEFRAWRRRVFPSPKGGPGNRGGQGAAAEALGIGLATLRGYEAGRWPHRPGRPVTIPAEVAERAGRLDSERTNGGQTR